MAMRVSNPSQSCVSSSDPRPTTRALQRGKIFYTVPQNLQRLIDVAQELLGPVPLTNPAVRQVNGGHEQTGDCPVNEVVALRARAFVESTTHGVSKPRSGHQTGAGQGGRLGGGGDEQP